MNDKKNMAYYHLPGLFELYEFYERFLPLYSSHRDYFYDWCEIGSLYGAPSDCLWSGGRLGGGNTDPHRVLNLAKEYGLSARLTFSNSLLREEHLHDLKCNSLCEMLSESAKEGGRENGVIVHSDLLLSYLREKFPDLYYVSSTTKVLSDFAAFKAELNRGEFRYVVADFRLNTAFEPLESLSSVQKSKVEFLCNEGCWYGCTQRRECYASVSREALGLAPDHVCHAPQSEEDYVFSRAMESPGFIGPKAIKETYLPMGFTNFKLEGRNLGSALVLEFLLYYMTKPEYQLKIREAIYLDSRLDLF